MMDLFSSSANHKPATGIVRGFIAISISNEIKEALNRAEAKLKTSQAHVNWVPPENIHLSMAFLGDITRDMVLQTIDELDKIAEITAPFTMVLKGVGTFGRPESPKVVWAGVKKNEALNKLQNRIRDAMETLGHQLEAREFKPHLTLGRVRSPRNRDALNTAMKKFKDAEFGAVDVICVSLMRSVLLPLGAQYTILHNAKFRKH
jgi:RNA 2',3'-cyclic 3'-phosphodiesterase